MFSTAAASAACTTIAKLPQADQQAINTAGLVIALVSLLFFPLIILSLFESLLTAIGFISMNSWKHPMKRYYLLIALLNLAVAIYIDAISFSKSLFLYTSVKFLGPSSRIILPSFTSLHWITCKVGETLIVLLPLEMIWIIAIFNLHRMLIIMYPFKAVLINSIFRGRYLILYMAIISLFTLHNLYTAYLTSYNTCVNLIDGTTGANRIWFEYDSYVRLTMQTGIPWILILTSSLIIIRKLITSQRERAELARSASDTKAHKILLLVSIVYFCAVIPNLGCGLIKALFTNCLDKNVALYSILTNLISSITKNLSILIRVVDPLIFYIMIPKFRKQVNTFLLITGRRNPLTEHGTTDGQQ